MIESLEQVVVLLEVYTLCIIISGCVGISSAEYIDKYYCMISSIRIEFECVLSTLLLSQSLCEEPESIGPAKKESARRTSISNKPQDSSST